jgi:hypothetical protein
MHCEWIHCRLDARELLHWTKVLNALNSRTWTVKGCEPREPRRQAASPHVGHRSVGPTTQRRLGI